MRVHKAPRRYTRDFKADAVRLVSEDTSRTIKEIAGDLGISHWTLRGWCYAARSELAEGGDMARKAKKQGGAETPEQELARLREEVQGLRRKVKQLETDREILKKATAFFAGQND